MALNGLAFAIDLERMRAAFGSKDRALLGEIPAEQAEVVEAYSSLDDDGSGRTLRRALEEIIDGECRMAEGDRFLYGYAIEILCWHLGEIVPVPDDPGFNEIGDPSDLDIESRLLDGELPLPVPSWGDTPFVRFLPAAQVAEEYEKLSRMDLSHEDDWVREGRETLLHQLQWTMDRGKSFITVTNG